jgi:hypothetical protein
MKLAVGEPTGRASDQLYGTMGMQVTEKRALCVMA